MTQPGIKHRSPGPLGEHSTQIADFAFEGIIKSSIIF